MRTINEMLESGYITSSLDKTTQTNDSKVYSFVFFYEENNIKRSIRGYVQTTNKNYNSVINGKKYNAFNCSIQDYTDIMVKEIEEISKKIGEETCFHKI